MKNTIKKNKDGYGYKYTELAEINKYCMENGITYYQEIETNEINQKDYIVTTLQYGDTEIKRRGCQIVEATLSGIKNPVQEYGSALTYCRRYSLLMALGLATEDDDAAGLTEIKKATIEDAKNWKFPYGKYKGETMDNMINEDLNYVEWYISNKASEYDKKCYELLTGVQLPTEEEAKEKIKLLAEFNKLVIESQTDVDEIYEYYKVKGNADMTIEQLKATIEHMKKKVY